MCQRLLFYSPFLICFLLIGGCSNLPSETSSIAKEAEPVITTQPTSQPTATPAQTESLSTHTPEPTLTPTPTKLADTHRLVVCTTEPSLPLNAYTTVTSGQTIMAALNDGPVDYVQFEYQSSLLLDVPMPDSGDVVLQVVTVTEGEPYFDVNTNQIKLYSGMEANMYQMRVRFTIRPDAQWSDGTPLTAQDSVYAFDLLLATNGHSAEQLTAQTASYRALDETTIEWIGIPGLITSDYLKFLFPPLPEHLNSTLDTELPEASWGAYQLAEWIPGSYLLATRNPNYFHTNDDYPFINEVEFRFLEPPYDDLMARAGASNCHIIGQSLVYALTIEEWQEEIAASDWQLVSVPAATGMQLVFNLRNERLTGDPEIRRAIASCIDRPILAELAAGSPADSYLHPLDPAYKPLGSLNDTLREDMQFELTLAARASISQAVIAQLTESLMSCGFTIQLSTLSAEEFFAPWPEGPVLSGQYDLVVFPFGALDRLWCEWFVSTNAPSEENPEGVNIAGWTNESFDRACEQAQTALGFEERMMFGRQAQEIFDESLPAVPLYWHLKYSVLDCRISGYQLDPLATELWQIEEIYIAQSCDI